MVKLCLCQFVIIGIAGRYTYNVTQLCRNSTCRHIRLICPFVTTIFRDDT